MNLVKYNEQQNGELAPKVTVSELEQFNQMLNAEPEASEIKINKLAKNAKYIPLGIIQMKLDKFFVGLWETKNFHYTVVVNEIVGNVTLRYYHPFAKVWVEREGAASVMIQQTSGAPITDIGAKIKNTLAKDHPHLLASCIANAAKSIGKVFGRDLNRDEDKVDEYESMYTDMHEAQNAKDAIDWTTVKTIEDLKKVWAAHKHLHNNKQWVKEFTYRKGQLSKAA